VNETRYSRNELLFGARGQEQIRTTRVGVVGVGGLGAHVVQQLAYLGVTNFTLIDHDIVEASNLNRLIGAVQRDLGRPKVEVAQRLVEGVVEGAAVTVRQESITPDSASAIDDLDVLFGCVDRDLPRLILTELCARSQIPYFDLASDSGEVGGAWYGGRIVVARGEGCLHCLGMLDQEEIRRDSLEPEHLEAHDAIYGIEADALEAAGPAIVSVNGTVASLAVTLFMELITGLAPPPRCLIYRGEQRVLRTLADKPAADCFYCGLWASADHLV
jgi:molybdopterin/thiamine biosynthesis adenylyltransferase